MTFHFIVLREWTHTSGDFKATPFGMLGSTPPLEPLHYERRLSHRCFSGGAFETLRPCSRKPPRESCSSNSSEDSSASLRLPFWKNRRRQLSDPHRCLLDTVPWPKNQ